MFISKLIHTIETYDPYGLHRLNGVKVVYVLLILFSANLFFNIPDPYFFYFYLPITAMSAEVVGTHIYDKYLMFICAVVGSSAMIILFYIVNPHPLFFLLFSFVSTSMLYLLILKLKKSMLFTVPIILSLAAYSLLYVDLYLDLYAIINNTITTLVAMGIILGALILFPLSYYYRLWLRAFYLLTKQCLDNFMLSHDHSRVNTSAVQGHSIHLIQFAQMLPRHLPVYTILKINLLINRVHMISCVIGHNNSETVSNEVQLTIQNLRLLLVAINREERCSLIVGDPIMSKLILSWNDLCSRL